MTAMQAPHGGSTNSQQANFVLLPDDSCGATELTNSKTGAILAYAVRLKILDHLYGLTLPEPVPIEVSPDNLVAYNGNSESGTGVNPKVIE